MARLTSALVGLSSKTKLDFTDFQIGNSNALRKTGGVFFTSRLDELSGVQLDGLIEQDRGKFKGSSLLGGRDNYVGCVESTPHPTDCGGKRLFLWDKTIILRLACDVLEGLQIINPRWRGRAEWFRTEGANNTTQKWRKLK